MTAKELREKRAPIVTSIRALSDKITADNRDFTDEERAEWKRLNAECDTLGAQAAAAERVETLEAEGKRAVVPPADLPGRENTDPEQQRDCAAVPDWSDVGLGGAATRAIAGTAEQRAVAMQSWMRYQHGIDLDDRQVEACRASRVNPRARYFDIPVFRRAPHSAAEVRAMSGVNDALGGYLKPEGFVASFEQALLQFGGIRQAAEIIRTATGNPLPWPTGNDTTNTGELLGENSAAASADPAIGHVMWNAYKFSSKMILVPVELLEDTPFDLVGTVGAMCGERIGRIQSTYFTTGTAANQPNGIVTAATLGVTTASATAITYDELVDLVHSVDPAYRNSPSVGFMFNDLVLAYLSKMKDGNGKPIWDNSNQGSLGQNTLKIAGREYPYFINQSMASTVAATQKTVLFGDFSKYKIRDVASIRLRRLVERYGEYDQEGFVAFARSDGNLLDAGVAPVKYLQQHA